MRRSQEAEHLAFDPEPERTLHARRRFQRQAMAEASTQSGMGSNGDGVNNQTGGNGEGRLFQQGFANPGGNQQVRRTLRDSIMPSAAGVHRSIIPPPITSHQFKIDNGTIVLVTNTVQFHGYPSEDPNEHIARFLDICQTFRANGASDDAITLRLFPFSLKDKAMNWLNSLPAGSITTWAQLVDRFLSKYFPPSKTAKLRNEITQFTQFDGESLYEAWERIKEMVRRCPHHGLSDEIILQTFTWV